MELFGDAKLLRIFIGELDKIHGRPLYEEVVFSAKKNNLAGATVIRGIMSYGKNSRIHTAKLLDLSFDLPVIIEIVDIEKKINDFLPILNQLLENANSGAAVTLEKVTVLVYKTHK
jgi:PII-like signaling protein